MTYTTKYAEMNIVENVTFFFIIIAKLSPNSSSNLAAAEANFILDFSNNHPNTSGILVGPKLQ